MLEKAVHDLKKDGDDLTYAYALFNLGHALRLSGDPKKAIKVLEERMTYPDQLETVQRELAAAYAAAGEEPRGGEDGPPFGNAHGHDKGGGEDGD